MSIALLAQAAVDTVQSGVIQLADPVTGGPSVPAGLAPQTNALWGYVKGIGAVIAVFALGLCGLTAWIHHQSGRPNESGGKAGLVFVGIAVLAIAPGVIGVLTGT
jgi:hypothetical protein